MTYRPEIDGLRALAVLPVILFHAGIAGFSGGFVGVDIFFVISGYLITSILIGDLQKGRFSIVHFYERRARRILPALTLVVVACFPASFLLMNPQAFSEFRRSVVAAALFISNIHFWLETNYFAAPAEVKPLLHTWSLAVEEQFYILFPPILFILWRFLPRILVPAMVIGFFASLAIADWTSLTRPSAGFFLIPTRAFELLAGCLTAVALRGRSGALAPSWRLGPVTAGGAVALLGLAALLASIILYNEATPFPSRWALVPVGGTALVVLFAAPGTLAHTILSLRVFVAIGLVSYSAYLWHQPLFAFVRITSLMPPPGWVMLLLAALSVGLGALSWRFVEQPFRRSNSVDRSSRSLTFPMSGGALLALVLAAILITNSSYYRNHYNSFQKEVLYFMKYRTTKQRDFQFRTGTCFILPGKNDVDAVPCLEKNLERPNYLLIGNSHGAHLWRALHESFPSINIMQSTASSCPTVLQDTPDIRCKNVIQRAFREYAGSENIQGVILSARWELVSLSDIRRTLAFLRDRNIEVILIGPNAIYKADAPLIIARSKSNNEDLRERANLLLIDGIKDLNYRLKNMADTLGVTYIDLIGAICTEQECEVVTPNGIPINWDAGHLTLDGSREILKRVRSRFPFPDVSDSIPKP